MGIFDDGCQQAIINAGTPTGGQTGPRDSWKALAASYATTVQEDLSISERQNYRDKVKQRNEKILEITGNSFTATANPQIQD